MPAYGSIGTWRAVEMVFLALRGMNEPAYRPIVIHVCFVSMR
jgi:hypothetical protein